MNKMVLWDFDGTLGLRRDGLHGRAWSMAMLEACQSLQVDQLHIGLETIEPHLTSGFPWHEPNRPHLELNNAEMWWVHMRKLIGGIFVKLGYSEDQASALAKAAQERFLDLGAWELFDDTLPVLGELHDKGWQHLIVSNHVPELSKIVDHLGLTPLLAGVVNSAEIGYEKPHPMIFQVAKEKARPATDIWMVGDNMIADIGGAEAVGIPAILVRTQGQRARIRYDDLYGVRDFLLGRTI